MGVFRRAKGCFRWSKGTYAESKHNIARDFCFAIVWLLMMMQFRIKWLKICCAFENSMQILTPNEKDRITPKEILESSVIQTFFDPLVCIVWWSKPEREREKVRLSKIKKVKIRSVKIR